MVKSDGIFESENNINFHFPHYSLFGISMRFGQNVSFFVH